MNVDLYSLPFGQIVPLLDEAIEQFSDRIAANSPVRLMPELVRRADHRVEVVKARFLAGADVVRGTLNKFATMPPPRRRVHVAQVERMRRLGTGCETGDDFRGYSQRFARSYDAAFALLPRADREMALEAVSAWMDLLQPYGEDGRTEMKALDELLDVGRYAVKRSYDLHVALLYEAEVLEATIHYSQRLPKGAAKALEDASLLFREPIASAAQPQVSAGRGIAR